MIISLVFIALSNLNCKTPTEEAKLLSKPSQNKTLKTKNNTVVIDTLFRVKEKICFPLIDFCLDTNAINETWYLSSNVDIDDCDSLQVVFLHKTTNIYPVKLKNKNKKLIINQILNLLRIENNIKSNIADKIFSIDFLDSVKLRPNYFFDFSDKNTIHIVDTINYKYINTIYRDSVNLKIDLKLTINNNDNLNKLKLTYNKNVFSDYVVHQFNPVKGEDCKGFIFTLKFIVYDENYFDRGDFLPKYFFLTSYKFNIKN